MALADERSYGGLLNLGRLLAQQQPLSDARDEMPFVVQHRMSEFWMQLAIHELIAARDVLDVELFPELWHVRRDL